MATHAPVEADPLGRARRVSVSVVLVGVAAALLAPGPLRSAGSVLLVLAVVAGLPHGAADIVLLPRRPGPLLAYGAAALTALALALSFPGPALLVLLLLSVAHFAEGERAFDRLRGGSADVVAATATAWVAVALPVALHPSAVRDLLASLSPAAARLLLSPPGRTVLLGTALGLVAAALLRSGPLSHGLLEPSRWRSGLRVAPSTADRRAALDLLLVVLLFAVAPPLAAFALWFAGWHAVRHTARVLVVERTSLRSLTLRTLAPSLAAGAGLAALAWRLPASGAVPALLVLGLLALTVPHAVVVARALRRPLAFAP